VKRKRPEGANMREEFFSLAILAIGRTGWLKGRRERLIRGDKKSDREGECVCGLIKTIVCGCWWKENAWQEMTLSGELEHTKGKEETGLKTTKSRRRRVSGTKIVNRPSII